MTKKVRFKWIYDVATKLVTVTDTITGKEQSYAIQELPENIQEQIELYGVGKILQDRASSVDADDKFEAWAGQWSFFMDGKWKKPRTFSGARTVSAVIEVLAKVKGVSIPQAQKAWSAAPEELREALKLKFEAEIKAIEQARKDDEADIDLEDLL